MIIRFSPRSLSLGTWSSYFVHSSSPHQILSSSSFLQYLPPTLQTNVSMFSSTLLTWLCREPEPDHWHPCWDSEGSTSWSWMYHSADIFYQVPADSSAGPSWTKGNWTRMALCCSRKGLCSSGTAGGTDSPWPDSSQASRSPLLH